MPEIIQNNTLSYDPNSFEPLRIRAYLRSGIISDQFLPIDGVVYYHYVRDKFGVQDVAFANESTVKEYGAIQLPFRKKMMDSDAWFYSASFAQWPEQYAEGKQSYSKRFRLKHSGLIDFGKRKQHVKTHKGRHKNFFIHVFYRHALYVDWYAVGDKKALEEVLHFCTHIGKKTSQGYGEVISWQVTPWPEDWSVRGQGGKLMRAVPANKGKLLFEHGVRPSYYHPRHQFSCLLPFS